VLSNKAPLGLSFMLSFPPFASIILHQGVCSKEKNINKKKQFSKKSDQSLGGKNLITSFRLLTNIATQRMVP